MLRTDRIRRPCDENGDGLDSSTLRCAISQQQSAELTSITRQRLKSPTLSRSHRPARRRLQRHVFEILLLTLVVAIVYPRQGGLFVSASYNYYNYHNDYSGNNNNNNYNNDDGKNQNANNNKNDDGNKANDDGNKANDNGKTDDAYYNDDGNAVEEYNANARDDDYYLRNKNKYNNDDASSGYQKEQQQYQDKDDDLFHWDQNVGFDGVSVMPISCVN